MVQNILANQALIFTSKRNIFGFFSQLKIMPQLKHADHRNKYAKVSPWRSPTKYFHQNFV